jgi:rhamnulose-1-phosphate aldolase/alcohol dehydrogenase
MVENNWLKEAGQPFDTTLDELVYRSNLLGRDRSVANYGGGNTSSKSTDIDFRGNEIDILWVKGSGSDLATMKAHNFTGLKMDDIIPLMAREDMSDKEMVAYLEKTMIDHKHPRFSIETLLHAFLPFKHVDHTHPDAIISIACADNGKEIADEVFGDRYVWVPYIRPGFLLSKMIAEAVGKNPKAELVIMEKHGLVTWGETNKECYDQTILVIQEAEEFINKKIASQSLYGGQKYDFLPTEKKENVLKDILPVVRGLVSENEHMIITYDDQDRVQEFVNGKDSAELSQVGAACPDHLIHTKRIPLFIDWDPATKDSEQLKVLLKDAIESYKSEYKAYFEKNKAEGDQMFDPSPRVILIPGIGMLNTGKSYFAAKISEGLYHRAISVIKGATTLGGFVSLNAVESFAVEYWPLELYKLSMQPKEAEFSRKVALITGGAGGIGQATGYRLVSEGAHVVLADIDLRSAEESAASINNQFGFKRATAVKMDVTKEEEVQAAIQQTILTYGGLDIVINNAGLASSSPLDETSIETWNLNIDVLVTGYFLVAREAFKVQKLQGIGGNMVFIGSKNSIYAGKNVAAYSTAKAAEVHLARTIATEGGEYGIRVNTVLPDAVIRGSKIWDSKWKEERASSYGIGTDDIEEHYRKRTLLNVNILPEDIAESIAFFASAKAKKTTGCMLTVDGGVAAAFTR